MVYFASTRDVCQYMREKMVLVDVMFQFMMTPMVYHGQSLVFLSITQFLDPTRFMALLGEPEHLAPAQAIYSFFGPAKRMASS